MSALKYKAPKLISHPHRSRLCSWATFACLGSHHLFFMVWFFSLYCSVPPSQAVFLSGITPRSVHSTSGSPVGLQGLGFKQEFPKWSGICLSEALLLPEELVPVWEQLVNTSAANSVSASVDRLRCLSHHENSQKAALLRGQPAPRCWHSAG